LGGLTSFNLAKLAYFRDIKTDSVLKLQIIMIGAAVGLACAFGTPIAGF
jgi:H+/Cl- antiporter ClcA